MTSLKPTTLRVSHRNAPVMMDVKLGERDVKHGNGLLGNLIVHTIRQTCLLVCLIVFNYERLYLFVLFYGNFILNGYIKINIF